MDFFCVTRDNIKRGIRHETKNHTLGYTKPAKGHYCDGKSREDGWLNADYAGNCHKGHNTSHGLRLNGCVIFS
jgi:hypothetical protein